MGEVYIRVPVICPLCERESVIPLRADAILDAIHHGAPLRLNVPCHGQAWDATQDEAEQVREYLMATYRFAESDKDLTI